MNIDNMKRLQSHLELEGQKFRYACYVDGGEGRDSKDTVRGLYNNQCGTVGCLAGMAAAIALVEDDIWVDDVFTDVDDIIHETAQQWLDLTPMEAHKLFLGQYMVERKEFGFEFSGQALAEATPEQAAKLLQMLIDEAGEA